jgi:hypothetical protein
MMGISFVKSRLFSAAPEGTAALFFIQIFSTLVFAVLYSTLVLYATKHLQPRSRYCARRADSVPAEADH